MYYKFLTSTFFKFEHNQENDEITSIFSRIVFWKNKPNYWYLKRKSAKGDTQKNKQNNNKQNRCWWRRTNKWTVDQKCGNIYTQDLLHMRRGNEIGSSFDLAGDWPVDWRRLQSIRLIIN